MLEDYSLRVHRALFLARLKAGQRGADAIELGDLLVALLIEDQGGFHKALADFHGRRNSTAQADPWPHQPFLPSELANGLLAQVEALCTRSQPVPAASDMPLSEAVKRVFTASASLRDELKQTKVEPLHLLAAVANDQSSRGAEVLRQAGITREKIINAMQQEEAAASSKDRAATFEAAGAAAAPPVYSKRALAVSFLARLKARLRGAGTIETEDLLVALLIEDQGRFMEALSSVPGVGIDVAHVPGPHRPFLPPGLANDLVAQVETLCSHSQPLPPATDIPMSEGVKRAFNVAGLLREALQQDAIQPLHLLAAVLGAEPGTAAQVFWDAGVTRESVLQAARGESA